MSTAPKHIINTRRHIENYLLILGATEIYDKKEEVSLWKRTPFGDLSVTICTSAAMLIAHRFQGKVFGYEVENEDKNKDIIGYSTFGHDFAIVGQYLVDYWARYVECSGEATYDLTNPNDISAVMKKYLPLKHWEQVPIFPQKTKL